MTNHRPPRRGKHHQRAASIDGAAQDQRCSDAEPKCSTVMKRSGRHDSSVTPRLELDQFETPPTEEGCKMLEFAVVVLHTCK
jgi:hypothetical protein